MMSKKWLITIVSLATAMAAALGGFLVISYLFSL